MEIVKIKDMSLIAPLFAEAKDTMVYSCLEGYMGEAYAVKERETLSAQIINSDFCFFAGVPDRNLVPHCPSEFLIMVPQNERWASLIEEVWGDRAKRRIRYAIKKETDIFDIAKLSSFISSLPDEFELHKIDGVLYNNVLSESWSCDFCSNFNDCDDFLRRGLGYVITKDGYPVSGASSYSVWSGGIEIEVATRCDMRRRGLATVACSALILDCISHGLYPSWDAHNPASVALSEKLGYHFDYEYPVYEINP